MNTMKTSSTNHRPMRIAAVDAMRALTMFLMLFVNDIPGVKNIPHWLGHAEMNEDMMGFSDLIFPAFLFCMGMSIPFAIQNRYRKGESTIQVISHLFWRSLALIVMGLFTLNSGGVKGGISHQWFTLLMVPGFFLVWAVYPQAEGYRKRLFTVMKSVGVLLLASLIVYKDMHGVPFKTGWWGILGLIGWTYAVCATVYLFSRESLKKNLSVWMVMILITVVSQTSWIPQDYFSRVIFLPFIPGGWTHHTLGMSGIVCSLLMQRAVSSGQYKPFFMTLAGLGICMFVFEWLAHPHWIISKILATPTWLFYCLALFFPLFGFIYWLTDIKQIRKWYAPIAPAGSATLTCYIIPYIYYAVIQLLHIHYPSVLCEGIPGLLRSWVFSFLIVWITGWIVKGGIKLKL